MRAIRISLNILLALLLLPARAAETIKLGAQYQVQKKNKLELRVTQVPKKYPWIEKDLDGKTLNPELDSMVVAENIKAIKLKDELGDYYTIPAGSKFFAKVTKLVPAKSFWRKEKVELDFFALAVGDGSFDEYFEETSFQSYDGKHIVEPNLSQTSIKFDEDLSFDSKKKNGVMKDLASNFGKLGAYTLGGAVAGPFMLFSISSLVGAVTSVSALTNPYVLGGAAAVGGAVGFASGLTRKGDDFKIEPGQKLKISLDNTWALTKLLNPELKNKSELVAKKINPNFILDILKVKKTRDDFGDPALSVSFYYQNKTEEDITYTSFQLIDSTGKSYEADVMSLNELFFDSLPKQGNVQLVFSVDYPNAPHQLKVLDSSSRKALAYKPVILD